ncbi:MULTISPECIES: hypothetical protein [unclassified Rhizobium]|jgi:hypothetical protein|uniref:hypothetical protein n=1 Tax=unclassified Rhizobium TaxID=2613769 RepID=UPI001A97EF1F|nr:MULTISPECIES: hypothetical protein [unclassified Rhizobium]MBX5167212.1 hypothetical protein [Rhizobium sp. NZLR4b]MBX5169612.1 hypothetical protein [Rhizobium sp. NZLR1b]MBX5186615.1 hypothetical protein [Rhizobium sp. NZLR5]MBX5191260.1 hypothetical protein [Rhizobium sp. NZLR3b]MBX5198962.1 hypothetical protein [Rhizobium sp. NZLR10]
MTKFRLITLSIGLLIVLQMPELAHAGPAEDALAARNPSLAALRQHDGKAFAAATAIIAEHEREKGLTPGQTKLPDATSPGRDMGSVPGKELTVDNPDILWLYNSSPEGMSDLISILKSAGQKPKN